MAWPGYLLSVVTRCYGQRPWQVLKDPVSSAAATSVAAEAIGKYSTLTVANSATRASISYSSLFLRFIVPPFFQALTTRDAFCDWLLAVGAALGMAHAAAPIGIGITLFSLCRLS